MTLRVTGELVAEGNEGSRRCTIAKGTQVLTRMARVTSNGKDEAVVKESTQIFRRVHSPTGGQSDGDVEKKQV